METVTFIIKAISTLARNAIDKFKLKNGAVFFIISGTLWGLWFAAKGVMDMPDTGEDVDKVMASIQLVIMALMNAFGAHTPEPKQEQST